MVGLMELNNLCTTISKILVLVRVDGCGKRFAYSENHREKPSNKIDEYNNNNNNSIRIKNGTKEKQQVLKIFWHWSLKKHVCWDVDRNVCSYLTNISACEIRLKTERKECDTVFAPMCVRVKPRQRMKM